MIDSLSSVFSLTTVYAAQPREGTETRDLQRCVL